MNTCPALVWNAKRQGAPCGRPIKGFIRHGHGRCGYHMQSVEERIRVIAMVRAERDTRELRLAEPAQCESEQQPEARCNDDAEPPVSFDVQRFSSPDLDE